MAYIDNITSILNIQPEGVPTTVRLSQNENGRNLYFKLSGNETAIPSGATVTISGTKPDGNVYSATGSITNDVVLIQESVQMTAVAGYWDAKIKITSGGNTIATGRVRFVIDADTVEPGSVPSDSELEGLVAEAQQYAETARTEAYGSPLTASTASGMTDHTRVYVYTGSETGYTAGDWYYWNGSAWTDGGVYNAVAVDTDTTLSVAGKAADGKATGNELGKISEATINLWASGDTGDYVKNTGQIPIGTTLETNATYTLIADVVSTDSDAGGCRFYTINTLGHQVTGFNITRGQRQTKTFTTPSSSDSMINALQFYASTSSSASTGDTASFSNIMIVKGEKVPNEYIPNKTAVDLIARKNIDVLDSKLIGTEQYFNADDWENGKIQSNGTNANDSRRIRMKSQATAPYNMVVHVDDGYTIYYFTYDTKTSAWSYKQLATTARYPADTYEFSIPAGTIYRLCIRLSTESADQTVEDLIDKISWHKSADAAHVNYLALGDSLAWGRNGDDNGYTGIEKSYPGVIASIKNFNLTNGAIAGSGWINSPQISEQTSNFKLSDYDLITVSTGVNDYTGNGTLGSVNDAAGASTICGKIKGFIEAIQTANPVAKIIMIATPPYPGSNYTITDNTLNSATVPWSISDLLNVEETICASYGVQFIDLRDDCCVFHDTSILNYILPDGTHGSKETYARMGVEIANKI